MRHLIITLLVVCFSASLASAYVVVQKEAGLDKATMAWLQEQNMDANAFAGMNASDFLNLTPKKYRELTGHKLGVKQAVLLKAAQFQVKKQAKGMPADSNDKVLVYILCWFLPPLAVALCYDIGGKFWLNVILTLLCGIPGIIHAFIVCSQYFKGK